jgi:hypothetical protein
LHGKLDGHGDAVSDMQKLMDGMPDHESLMKGVHGLLGDHLGDHSGKVMDEINKLPLPADEKVLLQAIENMQESSVGAVLEAIEDIKKTITGHAGILDDLHGKLDGHGDAVGDLQKLMDGMPDHDSLIKGVHGLLGEHLGDHSGKVMDEINKLPLPADEKVLLQAIENMQETSMATVLEAIQNIEMNVSVQGAKLELPTPTEKAFSSSQNRYPDKSFSSSRLEASPAKDKAFSSSQNRSSSTPASRTPAPAFSPSFTSPDRYRGGSSSAYACKCGFTCGTESALSRHLTKNTGYGHGQA